MKIHPDEAVDLVILTAMQIRYLEQLRYAAMFYDVRQYDNAMGYQFNALLMYDEYLEAHRRIHKKHPTSLEFHLLGWE